MGETVTHIHQNERYEVSFERSATKGIIGYKVKAKGDDLKETFADAESLKGKAEQSAPIKEEE